MCSHTTKIQARSSYSLVPIHPQPTDHYPNPIITLPHPGGFFIAVFQRSSAVPSVGNDIAPDVAAASDAAGGGDPSASKEGGGVRPGDWRCPRCGFHCFAKKNTCYQCGASKEGTEDKAVVDGSGVAASSLTDGVGAGDEAGREGDEGGAGVGGSGAGIAATPPVTSAAALQSRIPNQKGQAAAAHVLRALHCGPRNNGKYDALYSLTPEWHAQLASFLGLNDSFPSSQLVRAWDLNASVAALAIRFCCSRSLFPSQVTRSTTGKVCGMRFQHYPFCLRFWLRRRTAPFLQAIFFIGTSVLKLLSADAASKFKLVNTGAPSQLPAVSIWSARC